jgi:hypothetical protein
VWLDVDDTVARPMATLSKPLAAATPESKGWVQGAETTNVHPGLRIQDHEQVTLRSVCLAGGQPKGDLTQGE